MPRQTKAVWEVQNIPIVITRRRMKHLRITVHPPDGAVKVSVPYFVSNAEVQEFISERLDWVKDQRDYYQRQPRKPSLRLEQGSTVFLWGKPVKLTLVEKDQGYNKVWMDGYTLYMRVDAGADFETRLKLLEKHQRAMLSEKIPEWLAHWEPKLGVKAKEWGIKKMRTRWGSCNITDARIWLNLDLARFPELCLQYVVLHELAHLKEANHSPRFWAIVEQHMPQWKDVKNFFEESYV